MTMRRMSSSPSTSLARHRTLASLCRRETWAVSSSWQRAARTPWTLLAQMLMPIPVPQIMMARSALPSTTARAAE
jgi:hypothetical protein